MKRAVALCIVSIALCSGCGQKQTVAPLLFNAHDCPAPSVPVLPELDAEEPLESVENIARLLERDDRLRSYINGLKSAWQCEQSRGKYGE